VSGHHHTYASQVDFSSDQNQEDTPVTEFLQTPDRYMELDFFGDDLRFDDGAEFEIWSFETDAQRGQFPSPVIRVTEGEIFQARVEPSKGPHTIHWHGMEPDPRNDGVGHTSFEIDGNYTYQWQPEPGEPGDVNCGAAGTYFYHCHVNTVLHAQMGMVGALVIDPVQHPQYPVSPGLTRRAYVDGPEYDIDTETLLMAYSVDPRWHQMNHAAGLSGEDVGLNRFEPKHFYLLGGELARRPNRRGSVWSLSSLRANVAGGTYPNGKPKAKTLLRVLNANYQPMTLRFYDASGARVRMAEIVSHDGRPFRDTSSPTGPAKPLFGVGQLQTDILAFGGAERFDVLLDPPRPGTYTLEVDWEDWITKELLGRRRIPIVAR
jgi:FtsP/CotA-like multicopper oxidase with cupredoxin domain